MNIQSLAAAVAFGLAMGIATPAMAKNQCADDRQACERKTEQDFKACKAAAGKDKAKLRMCEEAKKADQKKCQDAQKMCELKKQCREDDKGNNRNKKECKGVSDD